MNQDTQSLFARISEFEWDEAKRRSNLEKHKIDFEDAARVFDGPFLVGESRRGDELRHAVLGSVDEIEIVVICTIRQTVCRVISARRARKNEREKYQRHLKEPGQKGKD